MRRLLAASMILIVCLSSPALAQNDTKDFVAVRVAEQVSPSLVAIEAMSVVHTSIVMFGMSRQQAILNEIGTGVVFDKRGYILCKNNLVDDAELVMITFHDGSKKQGEVLVNDRHYDLALIKVNPSGLNIVPVKVGDPTKSGRGDSAIAVGNSSGYTGTVTYGIISAFRDYRTTNGVLVPNMIQADCAINAGNIGAPLFNYKGEMIGMYSNPGAVSGDRTNINFFMPSTFVMRLANEMIRTGKRPFRPYIGILPYQRGWQQLDDSLRMYFDLPEEYWDVGILIEQTDETAAAYEFGLMRYDLIVRVEPTAGNLILLKTVGQLEQMIQGWRDKQIVVFHVLRRNMIVEVPLVVSGAPDSVERFFI